MGFLIVLLSFIFIVSPLINFLGMWAGYPLNSWQSCFFRALGLVILIHIFWHSYSSKFMLIEHIIIFSLVDLIMSKFWPPPK